MKLAIDITHMHVIISITSSTFLLQKPESKYTWSLQDHRKLDHTSVWWLTVKKPSSVQHRMRSWPSPPILQCTFSFKNFLLNDKVISREQEFLNTIQHSADVPTVFRLIRFLMRFASLTSSFVLLFLIDTQHTRKNINCNALFGCLQINSFQATRSINDQTRKTLHEDYLIVWSLTCTPRNFSARFASMYKHTNILTWSQHHMQGCNVRLRWLLRKRDSNCKLQTPETVCRWSFTTESSTGAETQRTEFYSLFVCLETCCLGKLEGKLDVFSCTWRVW